jgi:glycosyltransferase involved in cell wall biosynthesis
VMFDFFNNPRLRPKFQKHVEDLQVSHMIELHPPTAAHEMPAVLRSCRCGLIAYGRSLGTGSLPNRFFEYMAAGIAAIVPSYSSEMVRIVQDEHCGAAADFEAPESIANVLKALYDDQVSCARMGERGRMAFLARHNWEAEFGRLLGEFHALIDERQVRRP